MVGSAKPCSSTHYSGPRYESGAKLREAEEIGPEGPEQINTENRKME